jgi:hypothetical protein
MIDVRPPRSLQLKDGSFDSHLPEEGSNYNATVTFFSIFDNYAGWGCDDAAAVWTE